MKKIKLNCAATMEEIFSDFLTSREVISLVVTNPRITEWLYAGNLPPDSSQIPSAELTVCKSVTCEMLPLDKGHFITDLCSIICQYRIHHYITKAIVFTIKITS